MSSAPIFLGSETIRSLLSYPSLLDHLKTSLLTNTTESPLRHHHSLSPSSSLLLMPSWSLSPSLPYIGIKIVTSYPQNSSRNLPGIHASYLLFDSKTGVPLSIMDGSELTHWRTSCVSALASRYLSREDSEVLVMVGAGSLAPHLIQAHLSVRPKLRKVMIWNRNVEKARSLCEEMREREMGIVTFDYKECLDEIIGLGDIISCATSSESVLVKGELLKKGAHLDLVGSFTPSMRECDDEAIRKGRVFVDNEAALVEAGELVGAFERGVVSRDEIAGSLVDLVKGEKIERSGTEEITVFKSVGSAVVDIVRLISGLELSSLCYGVALCSSSPSWPWKSYLP